MNILHYLATSSPERAVWLSFGFYLLNVLVPIIPAVIIYRLFPEGTTANPKQPDEGAAKAAGKEPPRTPQSDNSIEGSIGGWRIKAIGAWGAYVTAFLLGFWTINSAAVPLIKAVGGASVWTIDTDFNLLDENGKQIEGSVDRLLVEPPMVEPWGTEATITVFSQTLDPPDKIRMKLEGYGFKTISLKGMQTENGKIKLPTITLKHLPPPDPNLPAPKPLPAGQGPPAVATTTQ